MSRDDAKTIDMTVVDLLNFRSSNACQAILSRYTIQLRSEDSSKRKKVYFIIKRTQFINAHKCTMLIEIIIINITFKRPSNIIVIENDTRVSSTPALCFNTQLRPVCSVD